MSESVKNKLFICLGVFMMFLSVILTVTTYAYYSTKVTGSAYINLAIWDFKVNGKETSFTNDLGNLYPGIDRSFQIILSAVDSEVTVNYEVKFNYPNNIPANLKFYTDMYKQNEINLDGDTLTGVLSAGTEAVITIYYDWPYGSAAEEYVPGTAWFNMTIVGYQEEPSGGE
ncbi:MAG: hypothetical protein IJB71_01245 [Bacilli bacterium]|nr:hypothetical protein [Bacilli bacterium]